MRLTATDLFQSFPRSTKLRLERFIEKFRAGEPFELNEETHKSVRFAYDEETENAMLRALKKRDIDTIRKLQFTDAKNRGRRYQITSLKKTVEFGGILDAPQETIPQIVQYINDSLDAIRGQTGKQSVSISAKGKTYQITRCYQTPDGSKSNIHFVDESNREVLWLNYLNTPTRYLTYAEIAVPPFSQYGEVTSFVEKVKKLYEEGIPQSSAFASEIVGMNADELKRKAVFGMGYGAGALLSRNNVTMVLKGRIKFEPIGNAYRITATHKYENGQDILGSYAPVLMVRYATAMSDFGVGNADFSIAPRTGKSITRWLT